MIVVFVVAVRMMKRNKIDEDDGDCGIYTFESSSLECGILMRRASAAAVMADADADADAGRSCIAALHGTARAGAHAKPLGPISCLHDWSNSHRPMSVAGWLPPIGLEAGFGRGFGRRLFAAAHTLR